MRWSALVLLAVFWTSPAAAQEARPTLPRVVLIGDSIRHGYAPLVTKHLAGKAEVLSPKGASDSAWLLENLTTLVIDHKPDLVHFNVGLHDLKFARQTKKHQVDLETYKKNLTAIVARLRKETNAILVFANTTPIHDERHAKRGANFDRFEKDVGLYNTAAVALMRQLGVVVHDLHGLVTHVGASEMLGKDGTHYGKDANARLSAAVADSVMRHLTLRATKPGKIPGATPEATAKYKRDEAERDAKVPAAYKKLKFGEFVVPATAEEWKKRRPEVLKIARASLGDLPERPRSAGHLVSREIQEHFTLESLTIPNGIDGEMTAYLLLPHRAAKKAPAILWLHSSSYDRRQLLTRGYNGGDEPLGTVFAKAGYVVLAPDACWYGGRAGAGPSGETETTRTQQESLLKLHLWLGRTLWGLFVHDDQVALDYLCSRPEVDVRRIGATGISMGSTRAWWLAAMDERIACTVGVACLTRYQNLIAHGQLRQHGVYYFVNGLLRHFDSEGVMALIAPRPFLALTGDLDAGSPADGVEVIHDRVGRMYETLGAKERFRGVLYKDTGHVYTPEMRREMLAWFARWLQNEKPGGSR